MFYGIESQRDGVLYITPAESDFFIPQKFWPKDWILRRLPEDEDEKAAELRERRCQEAKAARAEKEAQQGNSEPPKPKRTYTLTQPRVSRKGETEEERKLRIRLYNREYHRRWRFEHPDYAHKYREYQREYAREYRKEHKEDQKEYQHNYYLQHKEDKKDYKMRRLEHDLQVACVSWFRLQYPNRLLIAIPNGGARSVITGAMLKDEGVTAGAPDLFLFEPSGNFHGLAIEMKTSKGVQSPAQKQFGERLKEGGYQYKVCRSVEEFMATVNGYLQPKAKPYI